MTNFAKWAYNLAYQTSKPRWDSDEAPPEVQAFVKESSTRGRALDLGCGTGTNAIYLVQNGFITTGIDFSSKAIEMAQAKAQQKNVSVDFREADVTRLDFLSDPFDLILDVGCLHGLNKSGREDYALHATRLSRPDSTLMIWAFDGKTMGVGTLPGELPRLFEPYFTLERMEHGSFHDRSSAWYWFVRK